MEALQIINLPKNLEKDTTHRYGANQFKLHRLPTPRSGEVLGLVGTNGIGKSTALKVLAGKTKPNLGRFDVRVSISVSFSALNAFAGLWKRVSVPSFCSISPFLRRFRRLALCVADFMSVVRLSVLESAGLEGDLDLLPR